MAVASFFALKASKYAFVSSAIGPLLSPHLAPNVEMKVKSGRYMDNSTKVTNPAMSTSMKGWMSVVT